MYSEPDPNFLLFFFYGTINEWFTPYNLIHVNDVLKLSTSYNLPIVKIGEIFIHLWIWLQKCTMKHHSKEAETSKPTMRSVGANYKNSIVTNHLIIPITVWQCTKICKLCLSNSKITNFSLTKFLTYISYHLLAWYILIQENM